MALGGDKGRDMLGPAPLPAPPVTLSPRPSQPWLLAGTKGRTAGFCLSQSPCFVGSFLASSVFGKHLWQRGALWHLHLYAAGIKARNYLVSCAEPPQNPSSAARPQLEAQPVTSGSPFLMPLGALGISTVVTSFTGPHHQQTGHLQG